MSYNTREAIISLKRAINSGRNILLIGRPGLGKTSIAKVAAKDLARKVIISSPATSDPTDYKGLGYPAPDGTHATFLPFDDLHVLLAATEPTLWFIDDLGQANSAVQAAIMPWLLERRNGKHVLPDCVTIVAATNSREDKAGVSALLEPVKSRFHKIIHIKSDYLVWREDFAVPNGVNRLILAYLDFAVANKGSDFNKFKATSDMSNTPTERTWTNASDLINDYLQEDSEGIELKDGNSILFRDVCGAIGIEEAKNFWTFIKLRDELQPMSFIIENPETADIPKSIEGQLLVTNLLVSVASVKTIEAIEKYANRFYENGNKELSVSMVNDIVRSKPELHRTSAVVRLLTGDNFGTSFAGNKLAA